MRTLLLILASSFLLVFASCSSKQSISSNYKIRRSSSSVDLLRKKTEPLPKNFKLKKKPKAILGQKKKKAR
ncbi:MAG: hypothetical protein CVT92_00300 [Bacteroidetes bacterium HGW-Bacteroidetes-1]|nr:MAG: hypothetical protein CVT92_00300 [Bacteroidetes bacterium HGW-Bacteroidetes-1]